MSGNLVIAFGGDSISGIVGSWSYQSVGVTSKSNASLPLAQSACGYKNGSILMLNMAISGSHLNNGDMIDLVSIAPAYVDPVVAHKADTPAGLTARKYIFVNAIGSNDGAQDGTGSPSNYATAVAAATVARKTAGFDLCAMATLLPRNDVGMTEPNRTAYNALLTDATWRTANGIDYVVDLAGETTMGNPATCSNTTYYVDGIHPTAAGFALLAPIASSVWATVLASF